MLREAESADVIRRSPAGSVVDETSVHADAAPRTISILLTPLVTFDHFTAPSFCPGRTAYNGNLLLRRVASAPRMTNYKACHEKALTLDCRGKQCRPGHDDALIDRSNRGLTEAFGLARGRAPDVVPAPIPRIDSRTAGVLDDVLHDNP